MLFCGSGGGPGRAVKRLVTLMIAALLLGACGDGSVSGLQPGTEAGLVDFLDQAMAAFVSADFEAMHRMQGLAATIRWKRSRKTSSRFRP